MVFAAFGVALLVAFMIILILIPRLERVRIVGQDMHKPGQPELPEMGAWERLGRRPLALRLLFL